MPPHASWFVSCGIAAVAVVVAMTGAIVYAQAGKASGESAGARHRRFWLALAVLATWLAVTGAVAGSGVLAQFDRRPPPIMFVLMGTAAAGLAVALSPVGRRLVTGLPFAALIGIQSFRLPLELVMHQAAREGVMPVQMSFSGWNFDIVAGASAIVVAIIAAAGRAPQWLIAAWNVTGALLLVNVVAIGVSSLPMFAAFGKAPERLNTWLAYFPYVWLATVMVAAAMAGHLLVARKLLAGRRAAGGK
jgi:hypothetical protein